MNDYIQKCPSLKNINDTINQEIAKIEKLKMNPLLSQESSRPDSFSTIQNTPQLDNLSGEFSNLNVSSTENSFQFLFDNESTMIDPRELISLSVY